MSVPVPAASGCGTCACGQCPVAHLPMPTARAAYRQTSESVGREGEEQAGLTYAAQVAERQEDDAGEREDDPVRGE